MRAIQRSTGWLLGALAAASLTFGAASAFAGARSVCEGYIGTCSSQQECRDLCIEFEGGTCNAQGCCLCAF